MTHQGEAGKGSFLRQFQRFLSSSPISLHRRPRQGKQGRAVRVLFQGGRRSASFPGGRATLGP